MNNVVLIGRLTRDPELRTVGATNTSVVNFTLAINKELTSEKRDEYKNLGKPTADFIRVVVWGKQADLCHSYLVKGRQVAVQGSIRSDSYKDKNTGETKYITEVVANKVEFLEWGDRKNNGGGEGRRYESRDNSDFNDFESDFEDGFAPSDKMEDDNNGGF